jgi:hypothetical protein
MKFEWIETKDEYGTQVAQLVYNDNIMIEIVLYADSDNCNFYGDMLQFITVEYAKDIKEAKHQIENAIYVLTADFNAWYWIKGNTHCGHSKDKIVCDGTTCHCSQCDSEA